MQINKRTQQQLTSNIIDKLKNKTVSLYNDKSDKPILTENSQRQIKTPLQALQLTMTNRIQKNSRYINLKVQPTKNIQKDNVKTIPQEKNPKNIQIKSLSPTINRLDLYPFMQTMQTKIDNASPSQEQKKSLRPYYFPNQIKSDPNKINTSDEQSNNTITRKSTNSYYYPNQIQSDPNGVKTMIDASRSSENNTSLGRETQQLLNKYYQNQNWNQINLDDFIDKIFNYYSDFTDDHCIDKELLHELKEKTSFLLKKDSKKEILCLLKLQELTQKQGLLGILLQGLKEFDEEQKYKN